MTASNQGLFDVVIDSIYNIHLGIATSFVHWVAVGNKSGPGPNPCPDPGPMHHAVALCLIAAFCIGGYIGGNGGWDAGGPEGGGVGGAILFGLLGGVLGELLVLFLVFTIGFLLVSAGCFVVWGLPIILIIALFEGLGQLWGLGK